MSSHDFQPTAPSPETKLVKLSLGADIETLIDDLRSQEFDTESATYTFENPSVVKQAWLPPDIGLLVVSMDTEVKTIDICFDNVNTRPRPLVAMTIRLKNGEQITLLKDPSDLKTPHFITINSEDRDNITHTDSTEVGYCISSLLFPKLQTPDIDTARVLASIEDKKQLVDPTDPVISQYMQQLLPYRSDRWEREEKSTVEFEDDRNEIRIVRQTSSTGTDTNIVEYSQTGSSYSLEDYFEATARQVLPKGESDCPADLNYSKIWAGEYSEDDSGDNAPHLFDFMRTVIAQARINIGNQQPLIISYEEHANNIVNLQDHLRDATPDEIDDNSVN